MLYGTAHDQLNGHGTGLGVVLPGFLVPAGQSNDAVIACGVDPLGHSFVMAANQYFYDVPGLYNFGLNTNTLESKIVWSAFQRAAQQSVGYGFLGPGQTLWPSVLSMDSIVGQLKLMGVPFTAYLPPPAPVAPQPIAIATPIASSPIYHDPYYSTTRYWVRNLREGPKGPELDIIDSGTGAIIGVIYYNYSDQLWYASSDDTILAPPQPPAPPDSMRPIVVPPDYILITDQILKSWVYPLYAANPVFRNGIADFSGIKGFTSLAGSLSGLPGNNTAGLSEQKVQLGLYAYKATDLGQIQQTNGRVYELSMIEIYDLALGQNIGTFYETIEGGGGGLLIGDPLSLAGRIITDVSTLGSAEAIRFAAQKAGVPDSTITLATDAYAAAAIVVATAGAISIATAAPVAAVPETASGTSLLTGEETATFAAAAPETTATVTATTAGEVAVAAPAASGTGILATTGGVLTKAAGATLLSTGMTALSTEIKKLTGQLPGSPRPAAAAPVTTLSPSGAAPPAAVNPILKWGVAAVAALALLKKHSS